MTEQTERSRPGPDRSADGPVLGSRPLGEVRSWPRGFADRLTAPSRVSGA
ncbi:hypothetical protein GA0115235_107511 [Streptomyces sp. DpondAA-F4a]|nr:hypothetical protein GA0115235_107511 [Streptomyces sp. DpondAA-F4a]SCM11932.1 hypothetical protein SAMN04883147_108311 [Streptomyces sp. DpondAA-F4]